MSEFASEQQFQAWIKRIHEGDAEAELALLLGSMKIVDVYLTKNSVRGEDKEDLRSEIVCRACEGIRSMSYRQDKGKYRAWLSGVSRHVLINYWEKGKRNYTLAPEVVARLASAEKMYNAELSVLNSELRRVVSSLDPQYVQVITMRYFEGMRVKDIAAELGETPATISNYISYAFSLLRKKLDGKDFLDFYSIFFVLAAIYSRDG